MINGISAEDLAWQAVNEANGAFDRLDRIERGIKAVGDLSLEGVVFSDNVSQEMDELRTQASRDFANCKAIAAPLIHQPDSPFVVLPNQAERPSAPETVIANVNAIARTRGEMMAFEEWRGYESGVAKNTFGRLWADAWSSDPTETAAVEVKDLAVYEQRVSDESPSESPNKVIMIRTSANVAREKRRNYVRGGSLDDAFDIRTLRTAVIAWQKAGTDIKRLGERGISFLADYLNYAMPGDPLPVAFPPEKRISSARAAIEQLTPEQLLFEIRERDGEPTHFVSHRSLRNFAISEGYPSPSLPSLTRIINSMVRKIDPGIGKPRNNSHAESDDLIVLNIDNELTWGITPERFMALAEQAETSGDSTGRLKGYTASSRPIINGYVAAIKQFLASQ